VNRETIVDTKQACSSRKENVASHFKVKQGEVERLSRDC